MNGIASCGALLMVGAVGVILWRAQRAGSPPKLPPSIQSSRDFVAKARDVVAHGRFEEAETLYLRALSARPSYSLSLELAALYGDHHQSAKAVDIYDRTVGKESSPRDTDALLRYGEACVSVGRWAQARAIFHHIVWGAIPDPKDADRSLEQVWSAACVRDAPRAITIKGRQRALLEQAIRLDPLNWSAYAAIVNKVWLDTPKQRDRGPALAQLDRFRNAVMVAHDARGIAAYAQTLYWNGQKRGAVAFLNDRSRRANVADRIVLEDEIAELQINRAYDILNAHQGEIAPAVAYLKQCLPTADPHERVVLEGGIDRLQVGHAESLYYRGRSDEAIMYLDRLIKPEGNSTELKKARDRIERWRKTGHDDRIMGASGGLGPSRPLFQDTAA